MTAVVVLGAATLYMLTQQARVSTAIEQTVIRSEQKTAPPHGELSGASVRGAKAVTDSIKYGDMNERLPRKEKDRLNEQEGRLQEEATSWDDQAPSLQIQGVLLEPLM
jgi:hypothetical protein